MTLQASTIRRSPGRRAAGFTLVEVLIAMGIFAVGFIAVAAMFPAAIHLQKQTMVDVESQLVAINAAAIVRTRKLTFNVSGAAGADLRDNSGNGTLQRLEDVKAVLANRFRIGDRSYPTAIPDFDDRRYFWVPMIRNVALDPDDSSKLAEGTGGFIIVVFVLKRTQGVNYTFNATDYDFTAPVIGNPTIDYSPTYNHIVPKVVGFNATVNAGKNGFTFDNDRDDDGTIDCVRPGDFAADANGTVYFVTGASTTGITIYGQAIDAKWPPQKLWIGVPPTITDSSPCTRILLLSGVIQEVP